MKQERGGNQNIRIIVAGEGEGIRSRIGERRGRVYKEKGKVAIRSWGNYLLRVGENLGSD